MTKQAPKVPAVKNSVADIFSPEEFKSRIPSFMSGFNDFPFRDFSMPFPKRLFPKQQFMKTDIKETDNNFVMDIDLPGFNKDDVKAELSEGYIVVSAERTEENNEQNDEGQYICRERYTGSCKRSFYVGDGVEQKDIEAKFENGILKITVKKPPKPEVASTAINIQG